MRIRFFAAVMLACLALASLPSCSLKNLSHSRNHQRPDLASLIIDQDQSLCEPVLELIKLTHLAPARKLSDAIMPTQTGWLRPTATERAYLSEDRKDLAPVMMKQFDILGLIAPITAQKNEYDYAILLGAMYETFKSRLDFLEQILASGVKIRKLALLGSHRPLENNNELAPMLINHVFDKLPLTEIDMMEALINNSLIRTMQPNIELIRVASPMKKGPNDTLVRANTRDTVVDLLNMNIKPGRALVISSKPYILRQDLVVKSVLTTPWRIETVGPAPPAGLPTTVYLDELARILYELRDYLLVSR